MVDIVDDFVLFARLRLLAKIAKKPRNDDVIFEYYSNTREEAEEIF